MTVTTLSTSHQPSFAEPDFGATLRSEWTKLRSLRSTWIIVGLAIGLSIGFSAAIALVSGMTHEHWSDTVRDRFDPVQTTLGGWLIGMILVITLGVMSVASEYSSRTVRITFILTPSRTRVFAAKATALAGLGLATTTIALPGMFLISQPIFRHYGLETASVTDSDASRYLIAAVILQGLICTLIPFAFAWMLRSAATAIAVSLGFAVLPWMLTAVVPSWVGEHIFRYLPDNAKDSLLGVTKSDAVTHLSSPAAIAVVAAWIVGLLAAAAVALNRRDV
jgi:ABC-type transport system involved in multi-copper enzyme maturation permease subunit